MMSKGTDEDLHTCLYVCLGGLWWVDDGVVSLLHKVRRTKEQPRWYVHFAHTKVNDLPLMRFASIKR